MSDLTFDDITGLPDCERCAAHWWSERPRVGNFTAYMTRYHATNGHSR